MRKHDLLRHWLLPFGAVTGTAAVLFLLAYAVDYQSYPPQHGFFDNVFLSDAATLRYILPAVAQSLAATLGLITAIVLVIVQLSANRYTPKIIDSFTHNVTNLVIFSLFIVSIVYSLWVANTVRNDFVPLYSGLLAMLLMSLCFGLVVPYFLFIFRILNPINIVDDLRQEAITAIHRAHKTPALNKEMRKAVVRRLEQIADICMSCIQNVDEEVARHSVWALQSLVAIYLREKEAFHQDWHTIEEGHLIGSPRRQAEEIIRRQAWVEFRAMRQLRILYRHSSGRLPEINSLIAQSLRTIGQAAADKDDFSVVGVVVMFFNSLIRSAVALKDGRACSDTLYQYRLLGEQVLSLQPEMAERIVGYLMYYGRMLLEIEIRQIFDTVCYDIRKMNEKAAKIETKNFTESAASAVRARILDGFLALRDRIDWHKYPQQWRALLKHHVNLASFYLYHKEEAFARRIYEKLRGTPLEDLHEAHHEIVSVTEPLFWEISDRAINFNFVRAEQRDRVEEFIEWFETSPGEERAQQGGSHPRVPTVQEP